jgi:hypothetical protein
MKQMVRVAFNIDEARLMSKNIVEWKRRGDKYYLDIGELHRIGMPPAS